MVIAALVMVLTGCTQNKKEMNTLVAYFSATGTTEAVAKDLAEVAGAVFIKSTPKYHILRQTLIGATSSRAAQLR